MAYQHMESGAEWSEFETFLKEEWMKLDQPSKSLRGFDAWCESVISTSSFTADEKNYIREHTVNFWLNLMINLHKIENTPND